MCIWFSNSSTIVSENEPPATNVRSTSAYIHVSQYTGGMLTESTRTTAYISQYTGGMKSHDPRIDDVLDLSDQHLL